MGITDLDHRGHLAYSLVKDVIEVIATVVELVQVITHAGHGAQVPRFSPNRPDLASRDNILVDLGIVLRRNPDQVIVDGAATGIEIEIAMLGETDMGGLVSLRLKAAVPTSIPMKSST